MEEKRRRIRPARLERAQELRLNSTFSERLLWSRLRSKRLARFKFRRQHVIGPFIVDFYCADARLVIELDGRSHDNRSGQDNQRTQYLHEQGLRVVRYFNDDVIDDVDAVAEDIARRAGWEDNREWKSNER